jgi:hypothetical protein
MSGAIRRMTIVFIVQSLYNEYTPVFVFRTNSGYARFTCRLRQAQVMSGAMLRTCLVRMIYVPATAGSGHVLRDSMVRFSIWVRLTCIFVGRLRQAQVMGYQRLILRPFYVVFIFHSGV